MVATVKVFVAADNVNVVEKADAVNQEGSSPLALVLHGAALLLKWKNDWDWFVNLDADDYPLLPPDDFLHILSFVPRHFNFIEHSTRMDSDEYLRAVEIIVDSRLYLETRGKMFVGDSKRELPVAFKYFTGSEHVIVSRDLVEFSLLGFDNLPRRLLLYLTNSKYAHRGFFQTVVCNAKDFANTVINSNLRFSNNLELDNLLRSGAPFASNFPVDDSALDMIDSVLLHRSRGRVSPGGWCLGRVRWFGDSCLEWGDFNNLRPSPASKLFENLLLGVLANSTVGSRRCHD
ncbi:hypothetical protein Leryth_018044 [Lithospermum erythrorhizon]|nr:hypothetical protein Leryth_018044 [Lithospermum erythrorhizon]